MEQSQVPPPMMTTRAVSVMSLSPDRAADPPGDRGEEHEQDAEEHEPGAGDFGKRPEPHRQPDGRHQPQHRDGDDRVVPRSHPYVTEHGSARPDALRIIEAPDVARGGDAAAA